MLSIQELRSSTNRVDFIIIQSWSQMLWPRVLLRCRNIKSSDIFNILRKRVNWKSFILLVEKRILIYNCIEARSCLIQRINTFLGVLSSLCKRPQILLFLDILIQLGGRTLLSESCTIFSIRLVRYRLELLNIRLGVVMLCCWSCLFIRS